MSNTIKILGIGSGIGVAIIIGIIAYGEMTRPAGSAILERPTEQWAVGNSLKENTALTYKLSHVDNNYQNIIVTLKFIGKQDQNWRTSITVEDSVNGKNEQELIISKSFLPLAPAEPQMQPYLKMLQSSILWIVDYAIKPKYLASGAVWGSITHGVQKEDLKITAKEPVITETGTFNSYLLSYTIQDKESRIWVVKDMPLPVKAEVYDADGKLQFEFELVKATS